MKVVDSYKSKDDVPAPPPEKPWLRPGGVYNLDADRELCVKFQRVERRTRSGDTVMYGILAFQAIRMNMSKTFANSMKPQAERERDALSWLQSHVPASKKQAMSESDEEMSESGSTFAQNTGDRFPRKIGQTYMQNLRH